MTWALTQPEVYADKGRGRLITLTQLPTDDGGNLDWQRARDQVRDYKRRLSDSGYRCEWSWAIEQNPRRTGFHSHAVQWGDYIPQGAMQEMWGGRRVDVRAISRPAAGTYAIKEAIKTAGYTVKNGTETFERLSEHLFINGGRVCHFSRGFLHGLTSAQALTALRRQLNKGVTHEWHFEPIARDAAGIVAWQRFKARQGKEASRWVA